jgi:ubiquinone/menaquinone biosynthesis C-methylase UbiE
MSTDKTDKTLDALDIVCPECRSHVKRQSDRIVCDHGHEVGKVVEGVVDFRRRRSGVDAELVTFWSASDEYYETARRVNADFDDASHAGHRAVIEELVEAGATRVLDIGCGSGEFATALTAKIPKLEYVGLDVSTAAVRAAQRLGRPGTFMAADGERLLFGDGAFDAVISLYALEHFADPRRTLEEMARVVRPGGVMALLSISYDRPWGTIPSVRMGAFRHGRRLARWHPLNLGVYALNRVRYGTRQLAKQVRYSVDPAYLSFEMVPRPLVLDIGYQADLDAVHVVSGRSVLRLLQNLGFTIVDSTVSDSPLRGLLVPFELRIVARKHPATAPAR